MLPMRYIGSSASPVCFRNAPMLKTMYTSQKSAWMDSVGFEHWLHWWHGEVRKLSSGPWLLLLDNCGGHVPSTTLPGVRIELLPANTTSTYQPLDQGLISQTKIRYRSILLRRICHNAEKRRTGNHSFKNDTGRGKWGLKEGQLPHVADAITLFNDAWMRTTKQTILKCWVKSQCLPLVHRDNACQLIRASSEPMIDLTTSSTGETVVDLELGDAISINEAQSLEHEIAMVNYLNASTSPESDFVKAVVNSSISQNLHSILNSPGPLDSGRLQDATPHNEVISLYEASPMMRTPQDNAESTADGQSVAVMQSVIDSLTEMIELSSSVSGCERLQNALQNAIEIAKSIE